MLNDSFSCRSTFFCILRDKNGYTISNGTGNYYTDPRPDSNRHNRGLFRKTACLPNNSHVLSFSVSSTIESYSSDYIDSFTKIFGKEIRLC